MTMIFVVIVTVVVIVFVVDEFDDDVIRWPLKDTKNNYYFCVATDTDHHITI